MLLPLAIKQRGASNSSAPWLIVKMTEVVIDQAPLTQASFNNHVHSNDSVEANILAKQRPLHNEKNFWPSGSPSALSSISPSAFGQLSMHLYQGAIG